MQDPVTQEWFVRVRWLPEDALKQNYCFTTLCGDTWVVGVTKFHGNLTRITHGRPRITTFRAPPPRAPSYEGSDSSGLAAATEREFVATDEARYEIVNRQAASARPPRAVLCPLHRAPLAYRPTLPGGDRPPYTTLEVTVADPHHPAELWEERPDLIRSKGSDRHFIVETDEHGASVVRFGDGVNGQRPLVDEQSSPVDNPVVTCRYRLGQGVTGNVGADKLTGFDPKGGLVAEVWNPLDVLNGREPEPVREILRRAPECYRQRQRRAVTLDDYANRAREIAGVSGARARYAWTGSWRTVRVAIDPADTTVLRKELRRTIGAHLDALRLIGEDVEVRPAEYVPLDVRLRVCACQSYWPEDLRAALEMEFSDRWTPDGRLGFFHPNSWTFGQPLYASQLIGRALAVTGVERVVRLSVRRWNPGAGGGVTAIEVDPAALPDSAVEKLEIGPFEIIVLANDPDHLETGRMTFEILGGRR
jgi:hypothetical protein